MQLWSKITLGVLLALLVGTVLYFSTSGFEDKAVEQEDDSGDKGSLAAVLDSGSLRILTANNANSYYIYRSRPTGFEYDLARKFAEYLGVQLEVATPGWNGLVPSLQAGEGDLIAAGMTITEQREEKVAFSSPYMTVQQKLIHHKLVWGPKDVEALNGKEIHVRRNTSYHQRLKELQGNGVDVTIVLHDDIPTEELIRLVYEREIPFTVADSNIALLNRRYFPDIRIGIALEEEQFLGWAVAHENQELLARINTFLEEMEEQGGLGKIYERYYGAVEIFDYFDLKKFHERIESRLPKYADTIKEEAKKCGFDWRLIAAQVYQESHFNPKARSHTGVKGLMQVTLATAKEMGIDNRLDPQQSLKAGIRYLNKLYERFDEMKDRDQRLLFAMASYNIGYGHIRDAQKLAVEEGLDPRRWSSMEKVLPYLMQRKYYKKTTYGYARGREAMTYVERIRTYYDILKQKAKA